MPRAITFVIDDVGLGHAPDAKAFGVEHLDSFLTTTVICFTFHQ